MRRSLPFLLLLLVACGGGSDNDPTGPGNEPDPPRLLGYTFFNRLPQPDDLSAVSEAAGRVVAVGRGGAVVIREPGQATWRRVQAPTRSTFTAVLMIDAGTVLATNFDGTWLSRDGGVTWKAVDTTRRMNEIAFRNGLAVVGGQSGIIRSLDLENWEPAATAVTGIIDVGFAGDAVIWAMSASEMFRSVDDGKNWVKFIEGSSLRAFAYADEDFGALGLGNFEVQGTTNGTTFTRVRDVPAFVIDIDFKDPDLGVLLTRDRHVYTSDTRGKSWTFRGQISADQLPADIELTSAGEILVVGNEGLIAESSGGIASLAEISSGFGEDLHHVTFGNALDGLACGQASSEPFLRTRDGGRSWAEIALPVTSPRDLAFHSDEFVLILDHDGNVLRSDDFGDNWTDTGAGSESFMTCLLVSGREVWLTGGNRFIARTGDSGAAWSLFPVDVLVRGMDRFPGTGVVVAVGLGAVRSEDGGLTWSDELPGFVSGNDVACADENVAVAVGNSIYRTADQGLTWENVLDVDEELYAVEFLDDSHGVAVGDDGMLLETLDGGLTWIEVQVVSTPLLGLAVKGPAAGSVLIVGEDGVVMQGAAPPE